MDISKDLLSTMKYNDTFSTYDMEGDFLFSQQVKFVELPYFQVYLVVKKSHLNSRRVL